jgi:hypothetical protein
MKKTLFIFATAILVFPILAEVDSNTKSKNYIHPSFALLLKMYPRSKPIINPQVPRISAQVAYPLYLNADAVFFSAGNLAHAHMVPGTIPLPEGKETSPSIIRKLKSIKEKPIILFCD